jgi:transposase
MIHRWKKEKQQYLHNSLSGHDKLKMTDQDREIGRLEKALKDAQHETEILKKTIRIFSKSDKKNLD